jgi:predicted metalloprotease
VAAGLALLVLALLVWKRSNSYQLPNPRVLKWYDEGTITRVKPLGTREQRNLLRRDQVLNELDIDDDRLEEFIDSNLLSEIRIRGHRRFDSDEVDDLARRPRCRQP